MNPRPGIDEVRSVVAALLELNRHGWIGEGEDVVEALLAYIDGDPQAIRKGWQWRKTVPCPVQSDLNK